MGGVPLVDALVVLLMVRMLTQDPSSLFVAVLMMLGVLSQAEIPLLVVVLMRAQNRVSFVFSPSCLSWSFSL